MGACDAVHTFEAPNEKAALKKVAELMEEARYDRGHDPYGGHIGCASGVVRSRHTKILSEEDAEWHAFGCTWKPRRNRPEKRGECEKWGPAVLYRVRNKGSKKAKWLVAAIVAE